MFLSLLLSIKMKVHELKTILDRLVGESLSDYNVLMQDRTGIITGINGDTIISTKEFNFFVGTGEIVLTSDGEIRK